MHSCRNIPVFFYGSFMNPEVLKGLEFPSHNLNPSLLCGFSLTISPVANLHKCDNSIVYGAIGHGTQQELNRLYRDSEKFLGGYYQPIPVIVHNFNGSIEPAITFICDDLKNGRPQDAYIDKLLSSAKNYDFPNWYLSHIASFAS